MDINTIVDNGPPFIRKKSRCKVCATQVPLGDRDGPVFVGKDSRCKACGTHDSLGYRDELVFFATVSVLLVLILTCAGILICMSM